MVSLSMEKYYLTAISFFVEFLVRYVLPTIDIATSKELILKIEIYRKNPAV